MEKKKKKARVAKTKTRMGMGVDEEQPRKPNIIDFMDERVLGFAACFGAGSTFTLLSVILFNFPIIFVIMFILGQLLSLGSIAFIIGPHRQVSMMRDHIRIYATTLYLASGFLALICAFYVESKVMTISALLFEYYGLVWYTLNLVSSARSMVAKSNESLL